MAASASPGETVIPCDDFMAFQEVLRKFRRIDDNIISSLNTTLPTESFAAECDPTGLCKKLYQELLNAYAQRDKAIKGCLQQSKDKLDHLQELRAAKGDEPATLRQLRKEQSKIRMLRNELNVEEVVKDRSLKVFHERCRLFYSPPEV
ncbi:protein MIX23 [Dermacentor andersoni]|uniref:protein MIX23 n=1 Tax=Dermacentor andersoni TaxID=34620 RepID=UPI0021557909|nr:protein MIX23-like [Dermacentor andersoni]XP_054921942.1 protein MIX23-like [Dermacentor andersoni]